MHRRAVRTSNVHSVSHVDMIAAQDRVNYGASDRPVTRAPPPPRQQPADDVPKTLPQTPLMRVTVNSKTHGTTARAVVDLGDGCLVDVDDDDLDHEQRTKLSPGSHAFVRCYGERCLRCTLLSFPFGFAGGHPTLANMDSVLMAGELDVDGAGRVTRWLNKSGLYMPPGYLLGQSGLPFDTAWLYLAAAELAAMQPARRRRLVERGALLRLRSDDPDGDGARRSTTVADADAAAAEVAAGGWRSVHAGETWVMKVRTRPSPPPPPPRCSLARAYPSALV